ncbi:hypothetical protein RRG08_033993 [Elysia crispata]|uniref:C-type lectin domain-containing protein n=1 Tax=Elysia crispata TaxID=231223 RepID=A0AAE1CL05_9GAST|nr:hypothetical protein RRG08_033993 [Elysia crispata]
MKQISVFLSGTSVIYFLIIAYNCIAKPTCMPGWTWAVYSFTCLKISTSKYTWEDARIECQSRGGDLVKIEDKHKYFKMKGNFLPSGNLFWTGLKFSYAKDYFIWNDENVEVSKPIWFSGDTSRLTEDGCAFIDTSQGENKFAPCTNRYLCICEIPSVCTNGTYGEYCTEPCHPFCGGLSRPCDQITGSCLSGCMAGHQGTFCDSECENNTYGASCSKHCSPHCAGNNSSCDRMNGSCVHAEIKSAPSKTWSPIYTTEAIFSSMVFFMLIFLACVAMLPKNRAMYQARSSTRENSPTACEEELVYFEHSYSDTTNY